MIKSTLLISEYLEKDLASKWIQIKFLRKVKDVRRENMWKRKIQKISVTLWGCEKMSRDIQDVDESLKVSNIWTNSEDHDFKDGF